MTRFAVPELPADAFAPHYRRVIRDALLRSAEARHELHLEQGHNVRARRAERAVLRLRGLDAGTAPGAATEPVVEPVVEPEPGPPAGFSDRWFGPGSRAVVRVAWIATLGLLLVEILVFGVRSWQTGAADLALIVLTFLWFVLSVEDLTDPPGSRRAQLSLFE